MIILGLRSANVLASELKRCDMETSWPTTIMTHVGTQVNKKKVCMSSRIVAAAKSMILLPSDPWKRRELLWDMVHLASSLKEFGDWDRTRMETILIWNSAL